MAGARGRNEPPAYEHDEEHADDGAHPAHGREIEHPVRFSERLVTERTDDDIRRCADERHHAADDGRKRERHERQGGASLGVRCRLDVHRHEQRQSRHVVHHRGKGRSDAGEDTDVGRHTARRVDNEAGNQLDRSGVREPPAHDQHQGDDDRCRMSEAVESLVSRHDTGDQCDQQGSESDDVESPAAPDEKCEHDAEQREQNDLILCH